MKRFGNLVKNEVFVVATFVDPNFGQKPKIKCLGACTNTGQSSDEHQCLHKLLLFVPQQSKLAVKLIMYFMTMKSR